MAPWDWCIRLGRRIVFRILGRISFRGYAKAFRKGGMKGLENFSENLGRIPLGVNVEVQPVQTYSM